MNLRLLLPRSMRVASAYVKARKLAGNNSIPNETKITNIKTMMNSWIGSLTGLIKGTGKQDIAVAIGLKDIAKIFIEVKAPQEALQYLNYIDKPFQEIFEANSDNQSVFEGYVFSLFYRGQAYAMLGKLDKANSQFDQMNLVVNSRISSDPGNARLQKFYSYLNSMTYNTYIDICEIYPSRSSEILKTAKRVLYTFEERDPGNEQLENLISRI